MNFVRVRAGLLEPQHVAKMGGSPLTLYLWLHTRVRFKGEGAGTTFPAQPYRHQDAAEALGVKRDRIRDWFEVLVRGKYLTTRRLRHGLEVTICKYTAPEQGEENPPPSIDKSEEKTPPRVRKIPHSQGEKTPLSQIAIQESTRELQVPFTGDAPGADAPAPPRRGGNPHVSALIDALRAEGMTGALTPRDMKAVRETAHDPGEVAALYAAIFRGDYGDPWMQQNLSVSLCLEKLPGWRSRRAGHRAPARENGRPLSGPAAVEAVFAREGISLGRTNGRGRPDAGVGHDEARGGVPRQLRG